MSLKGPKPSTPAPITAQAAEAQKPVQTAASTAMNLGGPVALEAATPGEDLLREFVPSPRAHGAVGVKSYDANLIPANGEIQQEHNRIRVGFDNLFARDSVRVTNLRELNCIILDVDDENLDEAPAHQIPAIESDRAAILAGMNDLFSSDMVRLTSLDEVMAVMDARLATVIKHDYLFDCVMFSTIRVQAPSRKDAESQIREVLDGADLNAGAWRNGDPILFTASLDGELDLDADQTTKGKEYAFDCKIMTTIRVNAVSVEDGEAQLREALASGSINAGAWRNGNPIIFEASLDGALDLVEVDGESVDVTEVETHTTCCHNCQEQGEEVEVELLPVDGVFKGVCDCGCEATFECPPDVDQFSELAEEGRDEWIEKAKAENPDKNLSDQEWWERGRTLYIESLYEAAGGEW